MGILSCQCGKLLELLAQHLRPQDREIADTAFTLDIMSLMNTLFSVPMNHILERISVVDEVADALLTRKGFYGDLLKLAEFPERIEEADTLLRPLLHRLNLTGEQLYQMELAAYEWSDTVSRDSQQPS